MKKASISTKFISALIILTFTYSGNVYSFDCKDTLRKPIGGDVLKRVVETQKSEIIETSADLILDKLDVPHNMRATAYSDIVNILNKVAKDEISVNTAVETLLALPYAGKETGNLDRKVLITDYVVEVKQTVGVAAKPTAGAQGPALASNINLETARVLKGALEAIKDDQQIAVAAITNIALWRKRFRGLTTTKADETFYLFIDLRNQVLAKHQSTLRLREEGQLTQIPAVLGMLERIISESELAPGVATRAIQPVPVATGL